MNNTVCMSLTGISYGIATMYELEKNYGDFVPKKSSKAFSLIQKVIQMPNPFQRES